MKLLSTTECALRKGVTPATVSAAVKRGAIPAQKVGRAYAIAEGDCDAWQPDLGQQQRAKLRHANEAAQKVESRRGKPKGEEPEK